MLKVLAMFVFLPIGFLAAQQPPANAPKQLVTKPDDSNKGREQPNRNLTSQGCAPAATIRQQPLASTCDEACQQGRENLKIQNRLAWFTGLLVAVGLLQVLSMIWQAALLRGTLGAIKRQAHLMSKQTVVALAAARAAKDNATAALKAVTLQESQLKQWIKIKKWEVEETIDRDRIAIRCQVVNPTAMPITITNIKSDGNFMMPPYPIGTRLAVSPYGRCLFQLPMMRLTEREAKEFDENRFTFSITLTVKFEDAFGREHSQKLSFQCTCGRERKCKIQPLLLWTTHPSQTEG